MRIGAALIEEISKVAREQKIGGCIFLTVRAWHTTEYSAVGFYEKNSSSCAVEAIAFVKN